MSWWTLLKPWNWPEYLLKWGKGWNELRESKYRKQEAKIRTARAKEESAEEKFYRWMKERAEMERIQKGGGMRIPLEPIPEPGDDPVALRRAWLRYRGEVLALASDWQR